MKSFFKFIGVAVSVFTAILGALAIFDKLFGKNYYACDQSDDEN